MKSKCIIYSFFVNNINGDRMNENLELLEYMYKSSGMGITSLTNLLKEINDKENKIKSDISDELTKYEDYHKKSKELLKKHKGKIEENSLMTKIMSKQGIKIEIKNDNSDAAVAHMLIEGLTMGVVDMETNIKNMKDKVDKKVYSLAEEYLKFQQGEIDKLKKYL